MYIGYWDILLHLVATKQQKILQLQHFTTDKLIATSAGLPAKVLLKFLLFHSACYIQLLELCFFIVGNLDVCH